MKGMKQDFQTVIRKLKALSRKTEQIAKKLDKLDKANAAKKRATKAKAKTTKRPSLKKKVTKKAPAKRKAVARKTAKKAPAKKKVVVRKVTKKAPAKRKVVAKKTKTTRVTGTGQVLSIVKSFKKGVGVPVLSKKTRFNDKKVRDILSKAFAQGKVRRVGRGLYAAA